MSQNVIIGLEDRILITGAAGFIGLRLIENLAERGFRQLRCFVRPSGKIQALERLQARFAPQVKIEIFRGNLLSPKNCLDATREVSIIYHLAAGRGEKSYPDAFINSVVTTRNLLDATLAHSALRRFVSISSFSVYSNINKPRRNILDEDCPIEVRPERRGDAYSFAKVKQDQLVIEYGRKWGTPYVIVRPGFVYGPGNQGISGRVGLGTFGLFLHLGGTNPVPLSFVDNCAEAIVLAGLAPGVEGEVFNVVDDDLPTSRQFLRMYKQQVRYFPSLYVPRWTSYLLCYLWETYSSWSKGQLPPSFNRLAWHAYWKKTRYPNEKLKTRLGWKPPVSAPDAFRRYFEAFRREPHPTDKHEPDAKAAERFPQSKAAMGA